MFNTVTGDDWDLAAVTLEPPDVLPELLELLPALLSSSLLLLLEVPASPSPALLPPSSLFPPPRRRESCFLGVTKGMNVGGDINVKGEKCPNQSAIPVVSQRNLYIKRDSGSELCEKMTGCFRTHTGRANASAM